LVQYSKYDNAFSSLDVVKIIQDGAFNDLETVNKYAEGIHSVAKIYSRLLKEKYKEFVGDKLAEEHQNLKEVEKQMKTKYGSLQKATWEKKTLLSI
jgi:hypothetical protein